MCYAEFMKHSRSPPVWRKRQLTRTSRSRFSLGERFSRMRAQGLTRIGPHHIAKKATKRLIPPRDLFQSKRPSATRLWDLELGIGRLLQQLAWPSPGAANNLCNRFVVA